MHKNPIALLRMTLKWLKIFFFPMNKNKHQVWKRNSNSKWRRRDEISHRNLSRQHCQGRWGTPDVHTKSHCWAGLTPPDEEKLSKKPLTLSPWQSILVLLSVLTEKQFRKTIPCHYSSTRKKKKKEIIKEAGEILVSQMSL